MSIPSVFMNLWAYRTDLVMRILSVYRNLWAYRIDLMMGIRVFSLTYGLIAMILVMRISSVSVSS